MQIPVENLTQGQQFIFNGNHLTVECSKEAKDLIIQFVKTMAGKLFNRIHTGENQ